MSRSRGRGGRGRGPVHYEVRGGRSMTAEDARKQMEGGDGRLVPFIRGREIDAGDLSGEVVEPVTATFTYFGKKIRVNPNLTETMVVDLLEAGEDIGVDDPRQLVAAKDYVRDHMHPDDFDTFWEAAQANRQSIQDVIRVCWKLLERITERDPTQPPGSSDGRPATSQSSPAGASAPATESSPVNPAPAAQQGNLWEVADHFIEKYESQGRPDLANQIALAAESREARGLVTV